MITNFWNWLYQAVNNAISILNTMYQNSTFQPFFQLLIVIVAVGVVMKYIVWPMLGSSGSDKAKKKKEDEE